MNKAEATDLLLKASEAGVLPLVKVALKYGADVNACNKYSLRWASFNGHIEVVKELLEAGASISFYAIEFARMNKNYELAIILKKYKKEENQNV